MFRFILSTLVCFLVFSADAQQKNKPVFRPDAPQRTKSKILKESVKTLPQTSSRSDVKIDYSQLGDKVFEGYNTSFKIKARDENGIPQWIVGDLAQDKSGSREAKVSKWLSATQDVLQLDNKTNAFIKRSEWSDDLGHSHIKMDQFHQGIRVYDGEIILHEIDGAIKMQNGKAIPSAMLPVKKSSKISENEAKQTIISKIPNYKANWNPFADSGLLEAVPQWEGELVYYNHEGNYTLAYNYLVNVTIAERNEYFVDAQTGELLASWGTICNMAHHHHADGRCSHHNSERQEAHNLIEDSSPEKMLPPDGPAVASARDLFGVTRTLNTFEFSNTFFLLDASRSMFDAALSEIPEEPVGAIWTLDVNNSPINGNIQFSQVASTSNTFSSSPEGVSAHYNAGKAYDYFRNVHNRNSMSGNGQSIVSFVNIADENGNSFGQAFYNQYGLWYGNGDNTFFPLGRGLDVAGHELSHGVVQNSAALVYQGESGAMNESFADIFGAMIDREDWKIGEDVVRLNAYPSGALRDISDPHNGAATGDFGRGWQPRHYNERYTGSEDNGGVHLNSGIPNYAFYLFAQQVGKEVAEKVFYRALTTYLTRNSKFKEMRFATEQAARDLYSQTVVNQVGQAFADVGIGESSQSTFEEDVEVNVGVDLLLTSDQELSNLYLFDLGSGTNILNAEFSTTDHISKPSVTDNGRRVVFVGSDNHVHIIDIDWNTNPPTFEESIATNDAIWRNAVVSKDGNRYALLEIARGNGEDNKVTLIDLPSDSSVEFELNNPTFTDGVNTGDVVYADAMEFDLTGNTLMYDALNVVSSALGNDDIEYWDIAFLEVWNTNFDGWPITEKIEKLFGALPENISIGNPTYSKNSPYIIAFDVIEETATGNINNVILGMNIESNDQDLVTENAYLGYPNYSRTDEVMIFDYDDPAEGDGLGIIELDSDKISSNTNTELLGGGFRWGVWFTTGERNLSDTEELLEPSEAAMTISPVPADNYLDITLAHDALENDLSLEVLDITGKVIMNFKVSKGDLKNYKLDVSELNEGTHILNIRSTTKLITKQFIKI